MNAVPKPSFPRRRTHPPEVACAHEGCGHGIPLDRARLLTRDRLGEIRHFCDAYCLAEWAATHQTRFVRG